jgi:hypothetical protein
VRNRYIPVSSVTVMRCPCSEGLLTVTVTPGSAAPVASVTVPTMPPVVCADTPAARMSNTGRTIRRRNMATSLLRLDE